MDYDIVDYTLWTWLICGLFLISLLWLICGDFFLVYYGYNLWNVDLLMIHCFVVIDLYY